MSQGCEFEKPSFSVSGYKPNPAACCEACVFGRSEHAEWCYLSPPRTMTGTLIIEAKKKISSGCTRLDCDVCSVFYGCPKWGHG